MHSNINQLTKFEVPSFTDSICLHQATEVMTAADRMEGQGKLLYSVSMKNNSSFITPAAQH